MTLMEPASRNLTCRKSGLCKLMMLIGRDTTFRVIVAVVAVLLVVAGCSLFSDNSKQSDSRQLSEYFRGYIRYSHPYSDNVIPVSVKLKGPLSGFSALDNTVPKGVEDEDEFVMEFRDSFGRSLRKINFYVQPAIYVYDADPKREIPSPIKSADFDFIVKNPIDYTSVAVLYEDDELEMIEEPSANTPRLSVSWPTAEQTFDDSDNILISFEATDADEDELSYTIYYSTDSGNIYRSEKRAVIDRSPLSTTIPVASLDSSTQSRLAVMVTDGTRTVFIESPIFTVTEHISAEIAVTPVDEPPVVYGVLSEATTPSEATQKPTPSASGSDQLITIASNYSSAEDMCSKISNDSEELREYISGLIQYSDPSDFGTPVKVLLTTQSYIWSSGDSVKTEGAEGDDEFVLELRDADDRSIKSINFYANPDIIYIEPTPKSLEDNPNMITVFKQANFHIFITNPPDFERFAVLHKGNELEIEQHSANSPCLHVSWPTEGQVFDDSDNIFVSFEATDADGDDLVYNVLYSKSGGNVYRSKLSGMVESEYSSVEIPVASLDGSSQSRLAVMVTDGTRTVFIESPIFAVAERVAAIPVNQPPVANDDVVEVDIWGISQIDVLANDIDPEGNLENDSLVIDELPTLGTADLRRIYEQRINPGFSSGPDALWRPVVVYTPGPTGIDALSYTICDSEGLCDSARVTIVSGIADCTILGTENDETLLGTPNDDVICGLGGNDTIRAGGGNDIIKAGAGNDSVFAGDGDDTIFGETGNDTIDSGAGNDIARGGNGRDYINGGDGTDRLYGEFGKNILIGGPGDDTIWGGKDNDKIWGGYGNDLIYGDKGNDTIWGGAGDDTIRDSQGNDTIYPGQGNNTVTGTNNEDAIIEDYLNCLRLGKYNHQTAKHTFLFC